MNVTWVMSRGFWDQGIVETILPADAVHLRDVYPAEGGVVVVPARHYLDKVEFLNQMLASMAWAVVLLTGDEESLFPVLSLSHPKLRVWVQTPRPLRHSGFQPLPNGYPAPIQDHKGDLPRVFNWSFSGQVTHPIREACVRAAQRLSGGFLNATPGFGQGFEHAEYYRIIRQSKVVLCPSGPCTPDTFRVYEALELGAVPIVDETPGNRPDYPRGYWEFVTPGHPFPIIDDWSNLDLVLDPLLADWDNKTAECQMWWKNFKLSLANKLVEDCACLSAL